eukprot:2822411-Prymnesium_polylepis.1
MVNPRIGVGSKDGKRRQPERAAPRSKPTSSSTADVDVEATVTTISRNSSCASRSEGTAGSK